MKRPVLMLCLLLAGCATTPSPDKISEEARKIQGYTKLFCQFVPTIGTIATILSSGTAAGITTIAKDICDAVTTMPLADGGPRAAKVYGIPIKGRFVK